MTTQSPAGPGGYLVKDFADGWYWTPNAALDHASGALVWSVADGRYETDPPVILIVAEEPQAAEDVHRTMDGETVGGFRVAAWRYIGPQDPDDARYGYRYCEHWSSVGNVPKKVERLFTEEQLRAAMLSAAPAPEGGAVMRAEDAPVWADGIVTDGERVSMAQKAEADHGGTYWAVDGGDGGLDWEPTHFVSLSALATREEAPAEAGEIGAEYDDAAHCVTLAECQPGLFLWNGTLGFKSEYGAMEPVGISPHHQQWKVGNRVDAYCADSGEYFWGGTSNHDDRAKLLVYPISAETVAMVASHGPSALRAQPPAREDAQPVGWLRAVDEEMVCAHLGVADAEDSFETAKKKLASLIQWNIAVATDPSVGGHPAPDALRVAVEALERIATVDMGGGFLGAQACRQVAAKALSDMKANQKGGA